MTDKLVSSASRIIKGGAITNLDDGQGDTRTFMDKILFGIETVGPLVGPVATLI